jgi:hypothetical protein
VSDEKLVSMLSAAWRERDELREREFALEEFVSSRFNPPDDYSTMEDIIGRAADFLEAQPCTCTPEQLEDCDSCTRCAVLGRRGNEPIER